MERIEMINQIIYEQLTKKHVYNLPLFLLAYISFAYSSKFFDF